MAAEIGTMKVTEQIDALRSMAVHPLDYLVTPRMIAMLIAMPLLIAESAAFGILSSLIVGTGPFGVNPAYWLNQVYNHTDLTDIAIALIKGLVFGFLIVVVSCHQGLRVTRGAVGVGQGTTRAMVYSALSLLVFNFFLTLLLNLIFPTVLRQ
jgi:phospholipid/cholesterol/gamma-HCH transport system permease protein